MVVATSEACVMEKEPFKVLILMSETESREVARLDLIGDCLDEEYDDEEQRELRSSQNIVPRGKTWKVEPSSFLLDPNDSDAE